MKTIDYNTLFEMIKNDVDLSPYYGADVVDDENNVLFVIKEKDAMSKILSNASIEVVDASGKGISEEDLNFIKDKISQALDDETIENLVFSSTLPKS
mgnify:CR=1 FL=1